uniref:F-box domain-containing protein n=1 Tax=Strongyloides venezuelensis TaxID=75913 RepID=A0A0K0G060_STRVS
MDELETNLLSLPDNFKLKIFKKLDWKTLKDLWFVCRDFCLLIENNIHSLSRPKVDSLEIFFNEYRQIRVGYDLKECESTWTFQTSKVKSDNCEYGNFLRNKNFSRINHLYLENVANVGFIRLYNINCSSEDFSRLDFSASLPNGVPNLEFLEFKIFTTKGLGIPYINNLLREQSLRKLRLYKENESSLVIQKTLKDILTNNSLLDYTDISNVVTTPLYVQITDHLFELELLNHGNRCGRKQYKLSFCTPC